MTEGGVKGRETMKMEKVLGIGGWRQEGRGRGWLGKFRAAAQNRTVGVGSCGQVTLRRTGKNYVYEKNRPKDITCRD